MRYDKEVFFRKSGEGEYDRTTGNYREGTETLTRRLASVMDTRAETVRMVYGRLEKRSLTVGLPQRYDTEFDDILIDGTAYRVDARRKLRQKDVLIVSEVL